MQFLLAAGTGVTAFMLLQLWIKKEGNRQSKSIAMIIQLLWMIRFSLLYVKIQSPDLEIAWLIIYDQVLLFLDGPLIWFYTRSLIDKQPISGRQWFNFLPFLLMFSYSTFILINNPEGIVATFQNTYQAFEEGRSSTSLVSLIIFGPIVLFNLIYLYKSIQVARAYNLALKDEFSTTDQRTANWIITFQQWWIILFMIPLILYFVNYFWPFFDMMILGGMILIAIVLLSIIFDIGLVRHVYVTLPIKSKSSNRGATMLNSVDSENKLRLLYQIMKDEKPYLEEELTLNQLASAIHLKSNELTDLIKVSEYENFYDLVNSYRIEEIKKELTNSDEQVILIAYQCGFKSKSTFNKIFKEKTGLTPKDFRNLNK